MGSQSPKMTERCAQDLDDTGCPQITSDERCAQVTTNVGGPRSMSPARWVLLLSDIAFPKSTGPGWYWLLFPNTMSHSRCSHWTTYVWSPWLMLLFVGWCLFDDYHLLRTMHIAICRLLLFCQLTSLESKNYKRGVSNSKWMKITNAIERDTEKLWMLDFNQLIKVTRVYVFPTGS